MPISFHTTGVAMRVPDDEVMAKAYGEHYRAPRLATFQMVGAEFLSAIIFFGRAGALSGHAGWLWGRWSYVWDAQPWRYRVMSRATDEVGQVEPQTPRFNYMRKNFSAIIGTDVTVV